MSYYDATNLPEGQLAQEYTLADNFFHAAFGGSFLNHFWFICACTPRWEDAPTPLVVQLDANGRLLKDGAVTPDGYVVNTAYSLNQPHPSNITDPKNLVPLQTMPTIGDRLSEKELLGPGMPAGFVTRWRATPIRCFNTITSHLSTSLSMPTERRPKPGSNYPPAKPEAFRA